MPGRSCTGPGYRYGFNGKENDYEVKGDNNQQDYGMWIYDPRLGRFLSVDPLTADFSFYTPYQFAGNKPILCIDLDGLEDIHYGKSFKAMGNEIMTNLFTATGIKEKMDKQFALNNTKYDLHFVATSIAGQADGQTIVLTLERKDFKDKYVMLLKEGLDSMKTIEGGKTIIIVNIGETSNKGYNEYVSKNRNYALKSLKFGIFNWWHEYNHAIGVANGEEKDPSERDTHKRMYGDDYDSPSYDEQGTCPDPETLQDKNSPAYKAKENIDQTVDDLDTQENCDEKDN